MLQESQNTFKLITQDNKLKSKDIFVLAWCLLAVVIVIFVMCLQLFQRLTASFSSQYQVAMYSLFMEIISILGLVTEQHENSKTNSLLNCKLRVPYISSSVSARKF